MASEVASGVGADFWELTHPFPPLRMKAMLPFWDGHMTGGAKGAGDGGVADGYGDDTADVDAEISRLLAMMDPIARETSGSSDPVLSRYLLWGGMYVALSSNGFGDAERDRLESVTSDELVQTAVHDYGLDADACLAKFGEALSDRKGKFKAVELRRLMEGLLEVSQSDGQIDEAERSALALLGGRLGVSCRLPTAS